MYKGVTVYQTHDVDAMLTFLTLPCGCEQSEDSHGYSGELEYSHI